MATVISQAPPQTVAELVERLDGVPTERIRIVPTPGTATEADLLALVEGPGIACELVDGTLVEKPMGQYESRLAFTVGFFIKLFLRETGLGGTVGTADGPYQVEASRFRMPDVVYVSAERLPEPPEDRKPIGDWAPDLAVEVLSESNTKNEMDRKLLEYFAAGVRLVWYVDPPSRVVRVFTSTDAANDLGENDILRGGEVLPGFELSVRELFESV